MSPPIKARVICQFTHFMLPLAWFTMLALATPLDLNDDGYAQVHAFKTGSFYVN